MLSNTSKYAIRAMVYLAMHNKKGVWIGIKRISADLGIPSPFLAKILQVLAKHKLLISTKGPNGGFSLGKEPETICLFDIVTIIDGKDIFEQCLISLRPCHEEDTPCPVHDRYEPIRKSTIQLFKEQTIDSLARNMSLQNQAMVL